MVPLMRIVIEGLGGKFNSFFHIWDLFSREKQSCLSLVSTSISRKMEGKNNHYSTLLLCTTFLLPLPFLPKFGRRARTHFELPKAVVQLPDHVQCTYLPLS